MRDDYLKRAKGNRIGADATTSFVQVSGYRWFFLQYLFKELAIIDLDLYFQKLDLYFFHVDFNNYDNYSRT